ncbi:MAG: fumarate hydratase C-terminal domain-containing protein [Clostridia bacterium]|nr:fumarate hydratase C-terminal domain-containing protein [Clostridia bacterium]
MTMPKKLNTENIRSWITELRAGEEILLSGTVYSARDAAHKRFRQLISEGKELPIELKDAVIYYCGPTPSKPGMPIGSCGPTTSSRMDSFTPELLSLGLGATVGKGGRSKEVLSAIVKYGSAYLCAMGGAGAIAAKSILSVEIVAFEELGCESVKKMLFKDFPLIVGIDSNGNSIF